MSTTKFYDSKQKLTDLATKSESNFQLYSVASMFVSQSKYLASKLKGGECRCTQELEEAEAVLACRLAAEGGGGGVRHFIKEGMLIPHISPQDSQLSCVLNSFNTTC